MKSEGCSRSKALVVVLVLLAAGLRFMNVPAQQPSGEMDLFQLSWEKDFELILEINNVPTKGQVTAEKELKSLEAERAELEKKKETLEKRLDILSTSIYTDKIYDEMLAEGTRDISSTKESISKKLADVTERLDDVENRLRILRLKYKK